jgi:hypothetical protein
MNLQDKKELAIFNKFAKHCLPFSIEINSITKRNYPYADILCRLSDGTYLAFELVECIDSDIAKAVNNSLKFKRLMEKKLSKLPQKDISFIKKKYGDASICIFPNTGLSFTKLIHSADRILKYLRDLHINEGGEYDVRRDTDIGDVISSVSISNGYSAGSPTIDLNTPFIFFNDRCADMLEKKFNKKYKVTCKIDLLAYYQLQPIPENHWLPSVEEFLKIKLEASIFNRVWIYSSMAKKLIFVYPEV